VAAPAPKPTAARDGLFVRLANWLLSRLPVIKDHYETWSKPKRIIIAFLLYLVVLPVIPIAIAAVMYIHDPEGFKKSKAFPILGAIIVAQLGLFGLISVQTPKVTDTATSSDQAAKVSSSDAPTATGVPTRGRTFANCDAAFKVGVKNIPRTDASYRAELDRDGDGIACER
jgi:hypothetical protein